MKTIIGYNVAAELTRNGTRTNRTPAQRLEFIRLLSSIYASKDWRTARATMYEPDTSELSPDYNSKDYGVREDRTPIMCAWREQFRGETWADEFEGVNMNHRGWFSDEDCTRTLRAFVYRAYLLEVHPTAQSAADSADHEAQYYAEKEQAFNERWNKANELREEIKEVTRRVREDVMLRYSPGCEYARDEARTALRMLRNNREKLATDYKDCEE